MAVSHAPIEFFPSLRIGEKLIKPALFLAPMAGITNSAFRRLLADYGGYGALCTEMLSPSAFLNEDTAKSPFSKRRDCEGAVNYQIRLSGEEKHFESVFAKLQEQNPAAIDLNLGCPAPEIQHLASGAALFRDFKRLKTTLQRIRSCYAGALTVKCRLGDDPDNWREAFIQRLRLFEDSDIQAITVHPRFSTEKLKRRARWSEFPWIASQTHLPVIGNGDVRSLQDIRNNAAFFSPLSGLMLGRIAAQKPWIFAEFSGMKIEPDHQAIWERLYKYTLEDFPPERAIGRIKEFTSYFSQNYVFGHELFKGSLKARDVAQIYDAAIAFFQSNPQLAAA